MLRKSPRRTPALVAANRANALKSTGPRSNRGKQAVVLNRLGDGNRCRDFLESISRATLREQLEFSRIYATLHHTFKAPDRSAGAVMNVAFRVWRIKQNVEADVGTASFEAALEERGGWLPCACKLQFPSARGWLTVTVGVRSARGPTGEPGLPNWSGGMRPLHAQVLIQSSEGKIFRPGHEKPTI